MVEKNTEWNAACTDPAYSIYPVAHHLIQTPDPECDPDHPLNLVGPLCGHSLSAQKMSLNSANQHLGNAGWQQTDRQTNKQTEMIT